jgi:hypothetical protein
MPHTGEQRLKVKISWFLYCGKGASTHENFMDVHG